MRSRPWCIPVDKLVSNLVGNSWPGLKLTRLTCNAVATELNWLISNQPNCRWLLLQILDFVASLAFPSTKTSMEVKIPRMAMTTNSSISVNFLEEPFISSHNSPIFLTLLRIELSDQVF